MCTKKTDDKFAFWKMLDGWNADCSAEVEGRGRGVKFRRRGRAVRGSAGSGRGAGRRTQRAGAARQGTKGRGGGTHSLLSEG